MIATLATAQNEGCNSHYPELEAPFLQPTQDRNYSLVCHNFSLLLSVGTVVKGLRWMHHHWFCPKCPRDIKPSMLACALRTIMAFCDILILDALRNVTTTVS